MTEKIPEKHQKQFIVFTVVLSFVISIAVSEWVLRYQRQSIESSDLMDPGMILYDDLLGWKLKPHWSGSHRNYDYDVSYTINRNGFRGVAGSDENDSYSIIGDSFSFGIGVNDIDTFTAILNRKNDHKSLFHNFSVPGYSTDQQLLLIKDLNDKDSRNILLMVYLGNDIFDNMRAYPLQAEHAKPYFEIINNSLVLKNTPVPLKPKSAAARKETIASIVLGKEYQGNALTNWLAQLEINRRLGVFQTNHLLTEETLQSRFSESLELFMKLIHEIEEVVEQNHGRLGIVLLPGRSYVEQPASLSAQYQEYFRQYINSSLESTSSIKVMDMAKYLREMHEMGTKNLYYPNEGHLTPLGHEYVAEYLLTQIN